MKPIKVQHLRDVLTTIPANQRLLAIDHGTKTLGLAMSDSSLSIATPHKTIMRGKFEADAGALEKVIRDYDIGGLIIGWPVNMDGSQGARTQSVRDYLTLLIPRLNNIWWAVWDERLSSNVAHNLMTSEMDLTFAKRKKAVDSLAAHAIMQDALMFINSHR